MTKFDNYDNLLYNDIKHSLNRFMKKVGMEMLNNMLQDIDIQDIEKNFSDKGFHEFIEEDRRRCLLEYKEEVSRVWDLDCLVDTEESYRIIMEEHGIERYLKLS